jgi:hypothetical protein
VPEPHTDYGAHVLLRHDEKQTAIFFSLLAPQVDTRHPGTREKAAKSREAVLEV